MQRVQDNGVTSMTESGGLDISKRCRFPFEPELTEDKGVLQTQTANKPCVHPEMSGDFVHVHTRVLWRQDDNMKAKANPVHSGAH